MGAKAGSYEPASNAPIVLPAIFIRDGLFDQLAVLRPALRGELLIDISSPFNTDYSDFILPWDQRRRADSGTPSRSACSGCVQAPSEAELQQYFRVSPPSVHQMILTLEARGLIERTPGQARSIHLLIRREEPPDLL